MMKNQKQAGRDLSPRSVVLNSLFFVLTMALSIATLWPIYQHVQLFVVLGAALVAGSAVAIIGAVARLKFWLVALLTLVLYLVLGSGLAVPGYATSGFIPSVDGARELVFATALGWKRLLTIDAPVGQYEALLVPPFVLVLLGSVVGLSVILRAKRFQSAGVLAPIVVFVFGIVYGVATVRSPVGEISPRWWLVIQGFALLAVSMIWMLWRARRRRSLATAVMSSLDGAPVVAKQGAWPRVRSAFSALIVLAIGAGVAAGAVSVVSPSTPREVLRDSVQKPFDPRDYASPLSAFREYLADDTANQTMFTVDGLPEGGRVRIATLDAYDGVLYRVGSPNTPSETSDFTRVPYRVDQSDRDGSSAELSFSIENYSGVWVPTSGWLESIDFAGPRASSLTNSFFFNPGGGTAAVTVGLKSGDSYTLRAILEPQPSKDDLSSLTPGSDAVPDLVDLPPIIRSTVRDWAGDVKQPGGRIVAVMDALHEGYISHGRDSEPYSRSGHALDRVIQFLDSPRLLGDAEQYAVTMALLAREIGYPSRVVFGFLPEKGSTAVTGENVTAWTEINTKEQGWVTIDATPEWREIPEAEPQDPEKVSHPLSVPPPPPAETDDTAVPYRPDGEDRKPDAEMPAWLAILLFLLPILGWVLLVVAIVCLPFVAIVWAKRRRSLSRERAAEPLARVTGAWREVVDIAVDHGEPLPGAMTRLEYADLIGKNRVRGLARAADRAVFNDGPVDPAIVQHFWSEVHALRKDWDKTMNRRQRFRAKFSLRSLGIIGRVGTASVDSERAQRPNSDTSFISL